MFIIAGLYRGQRLIPPKGGHTRPTASRLREAVFNICQHVIEGARFLDVFAGSGAMGLEALSRGAQSATFIESNKAAIQCIEHNITHLRVQAQTKILRGEVFKMLAWLERQAETFDIIYVDPPYRTPAPHTSSFYSTEVIQWIDQHSLLSPNGLTFVEEDFRSEPHLSHLSKVQLNNSRRFGDTVLQQYQCSLV
jgi:16S rRNA (guanine966-N2)-methyltransferase